MQDFELKTALHVEKVKRLDILEENKIRAKVQIEDYQKLLEYTKDWINPGKLVYKLDLLILNQEAYLVSINSEMNKLKQEIANA